jgi:alpha-amylase
MLAWPYGYPSLMSSFGFDRGSAAGRDAGPPSDGGGTTRAIYAEGAGAPDCVAPPLSAATAGWVCEHRAPAVANMVAFRRATAGAPVVEYWDNGQNQLAFGRAKLGFVAINHESSALEQTLATGLPEGRYCDVLSGDFSTTDGSCSGAVVSVDASGNASLSVAPESALALHVGARVE